MWKNFFISAWQNLIANKVFSCINILGLSLGIAVCTLILLFVRKESGYEQWVDKPGNIVRLHTAYTLPNTPEFLTVRSAGKMKQAMLSYAPEAFIDGTHVIPYERTIQKDAEVYNETFTFVNQNFLDFFPLPLTQGQTQQALNKPNNMIISEAMALKYFGRTDVVGETLTICCVSDATLILPIVAVAKMPRNTHLKLDFVVRMNEAKLAKLPGLLNTWSSVNVYTYFKLAPGTHPVEAQARIHHWANHESHWVENLPQDSNQNPTGKVTDTVSYSLMPLPDLHLKAKPYAGSMGDMTPMGDYQMIRNFSLISILVLVIACINFMNLATARSTRRAKEVIIRKILGASRVQIALQFLGEALLVVFIGFLLALCLVELVLPLYNSAIGHQLEFNLLHEPRLVALCLGAVVLIGLAAGAYPAFVLSRFTPTKVLSASKGAESGTSSKLRDALVILQFAISVGLLASTAVIYRQNQYTQNLNLGFDYNNKLILDISESRDIAPSLKQQLESIPGIEHVVFSSEAPSQDFENNRYFRRLNAPDIHGLLNYYHVGYGFFESYGIQPVAGRVFSEDFGGDAIDPEHTGSKENPGQASAVVNRRMLKKFGFNKPEDAIGQVLTLDIAKGHHHLTIIGVIPDIHFRSLKFGVRDNVYMLNPRRFRAATISYRSNNLPQLLTSIEKVWQQLAPQQPIKIQFLSEMIAAQYRGEQIQAKMFAAFAILAMIVACLGLYGLISFATQRRTREIGIRKVLGAEVSDIVRLLLWQFSKPVLIANLIAWPMVWFFMSRWLTNFPQRIEDYWVIIAALAASLVCAGIAWCTVGLNASIAASAKPTNALRHE